MQNELKTAIRFDDFHAAFGAEGVVIMAWSLGAKLAEGIRTEQWGFPFLHITGGAGYGKSSLQSYLGKLLGKATFTACAPENATRAGLLRTIANAGERKSVVIFESMPTGEESAFDWDELKGLYNNGATIYRQANEVEPIQFHGAVIITSNQPIECNDAVRTRIALVRLAAPSAEKHPHALALEELAAEQASAFGIAVDEQAEQLLSTVNKLAPVYTASLLEQHADQLSPRAARNGGQLKALIDALSLLLNLSHEQREQALSEVEYCVCPEFIPY
jgi:hypothetical protein